MIQLKKSDEMKNKLFGLWFIFLSAWLMIAGTLDIQTVLVGAVVSFFVALYTQKDDPIPLRLTLKTLPIWARLARHFLWDLVVSNVMLARLLLSPKMKLNPRFIKIQQPLQDPILQTLYANSITLTPGTLTVLCEDDYLLIHCLTDEAVESLIEHKVRADFIALEEGQHGR